MVREFISAPRHATEMEAFTQNRKTRQPTVSPNGSITQGRATGTSGMDMISTAKTLMPGNVALVNVNG